MIYVVENICVGHRVLSQVLGNVLGFMTDLQLINTGLLLGSKSILGEYRKTIGENHLIRVMMKSKYS